MVSRKRIRSLLRGQSPKKGTIPSKGDRFHESYSEEETRKFAERLAKKLCPGAVVALTGPIGSGKTVFIKGLCRGLGVRKSEEVKSPTFVLLHIYEGRAPIYHFDLYRLEDEKELDPIGFDEFVSGGQAISCVEWAERAPRRIPKGSIWVELKITGPASRRIRIKGAR